VVLILGADNPCETPVAKQICQKKDPVKSETCQCPLLFTDVNKKSDWQGKSGPSWLLF
jgi:hypothetical protein